MVKFAVGGFSSFLHHLLAGVGAGDRDEAGNGSMLAHLCSIKNDLAHSTVF